MLEVSREEVETWRKDTPGTRHVTHLNNAGSSLMAEPVMKVIRDHLELELIMGGYEAAALRENSVREFYESAAVAFCARPENFAFTANATDAYSRALSAISLVSGDYIVTSSNDYISNILTFHSLQKRWGIKIHIVQNDPSGNIDLDVLEQDIRRLHPRIVSITHMPTNSGLIQPVREIGEICRKHDLWYIIDGCQTAGQMDLDLSSLHCDFFSATFRKFLRGPRGCGFLYMSDRVLQSDLHPLFLDMRGADWIAEGQYQLRPDGRRFEDWENAYALMFGAAEALRYAVRIGFPRIQKRSFQLAQLLREGFRSHPGLRVLDRGKQQGAIVTIYIPGEDPQSIKARLAHAGINCSLTSLSNAPYDFMEKGVNWALRLSPHYYNTEEEMDMTLTLL